jgi:hypothetical protein
MLAESLPNRRTLLSVRLQSSSERSPTTQMLAHRIHNFGIMLEPRWIVGTGVLDQ